MRKAKWAAAAAGVVLLVSGCGGEDGSKAKDDAKDKAPASAAPETSAVPDEEAGPDAETVREEIEKAATGAGLTKAGGPAPEGSLDDIEGCAVVWRADTEQSEDNKKAYEATIAELAEQGWEKQELIDAEVSLIQPMEKKGWALNVSYSGSPDVYESVVFEGISETEECGDKIVEAMEGTS
ncbi:hypothetical protein JJV70_07455 [Streptomyces sp. JJ66]|uniref:hypothetical protein n=1 Tax=Streptomyces sp. JJ66 TaxID=2803843 RepID=UPI001C580590|nr:hypothetical protein [Streptomyces sp. JJ66]MBW1601949.1 hypothetical protein [Streptomyces sp. JJ66]